MQEKYLINVGRETVGLKYDRRLSKLVLGGNGRFRRTMRSILTEYVGTHVPREKEVQRNKIRYELTVKIGRVEQALEELRDHGFVLKQVRTLGRIMR